MKFNPLVMLFSCSILTISCGNDANKVIEGKKDLINPSTVVQNPRSINGIPKEQAASLPILSFKDSTHNFGTISEGERVTYDFAFTNTGKTPLLIQSADGSCGCTVADYPRDPIAPGSNAVMKVVFSSAGKQGHQEKDVAVHSNTLRGVQHLNITVDVTPQEKN